MTRLWAWWEGRPFSAYAALMLLVYSICALALLGRHEWNPSVLFRFGHYYSEQNPTLIPEGALVFVGEERFGGNGYDGQIFYYYSRTLFTRHLWPGGFNNAYRAPRVGYPLLGAPFALLGSWAVLAALVLAQILLVFLGGFFLHRLLPPGRKSLLLLYALSPFMLQSVLLMVSDSIVVAVLLCGFYFYCASRSPFAGDDSGSFDYHKATLGQLCVAWAFFALALLTKESAVFLLFPLGLHALLVLDVRRSVVLLAALVPYVAWQLYLQQAHGMVPAGILSVFLSPLDGVRGLIRETFQVLGEAAARKPAAPAALAKLSARWMLVGLIAATCVALFGRRRRNWVPFPLALLLALASVLIADHYYFWSVYENISRMFTPLVVIFVLFAARDRSISVRPFGWALGVLAIMVLLRSVLLVPDFPYERFEGYGGSDYRDHAPLPGRSVPVGP